MAAYGARIAAENAPNGDSKRYDATVMPAVVFSDPQVASVGLMEVAARNKGLEVKTSTLELGYVPRALAARHAWPYQARCRRGQRKIAGRAHSGA